MATRGLLLALGPAAALGLGRFAYALVLPLMQAAWGLSYAEGGLLGSANTLGYLLGALLSHPLLERVGYIGYMTFITTAVGNWPLLFTLLGLGALLTGPLWGPWVERVGGRRGIFHVLLVLFLGSLPPLALRLPPLSALLFGLSFLGVITAITQAFRAALPLPPGPGPWGFPLRPSLWARLWGPRWRASSPSAWAKGKGPSGRPAPFFSWPFSPPFPKSAEGPPALSTKALGAFGVLRSRKGPGTWPPGT
jgi:hypothetical protein